MIQPSNEALFHSTPFGDLVLVEGIRPPLMDDVLLDRLGEHAYAAIELKISDELNAAKKDGRAHDWATPVMDPTRARNHEKIFGKHNEPRPIYLEPAVSPNDILARDYGYTITSAGLGERWNFALGNSHRALQLFEEKGMVREAEEVRALILEAISRAGISIDELPAELTVSIMKVDSNAPALALPSTERGTSIASQELRVFEPIPAEFITKVGEVRVPSTNTDVGRFLLGQDSRFSEVAGYAFK